MFERNSDLLQKVKTILFYKNWIIPKKMLDMKKTKFTNKANKKTFIIIHVICITTNIIRLCSSNFEALYLWLDTTEGPLVASLYLLQHYHLILLILLFLFCSYVLPHYSPTPTRLYENHNALHICNAHYFTYYTLCSLLSQALALCSRV